MYEPRIIDSILDELMPGLPAILLEGAKSVGKTATASRRARSAFHLDDPADIALLRADPANLDRAPAPVLVDEWQRMPELWDRVRRAVDAGATPGQYLLTGSAVPVGAPVHSGAGRIDPIRMRPMSLAERMPGHITVSLAALLRGGRPPLDGETAMVAGGYASEILRSGFPGLRNTEGRMLRARLDGYLENVVRHEFPEQGAHVRRPETLRRWLRAYAAATSTTASYATVLRAAAGEREPPPAKTSTIAYRDVLTQLWLIDPLDGWQPTGSELSRVAKAPKHQLADPALAARLLDLTDVDFTAGGRGVRLFGQLFEHLVALGVQTYAGAAEARIGHLRTQGGEHEVDMIVERGEHVVAIEVKAARTIDDHDVRHLSWLAGLLGDRLVDSIVVTTGPRAYRRADGIGVVPAALLGP